MSNNIEMHTIFIHITVKACVKVTCMSIQFQYIGRAIPEVVLYHPFKKNNNILIVLKIVLERGSPVTVSPRTLIYIQYCKLLHVKLGLAIFSHWTFKQAFAATPISFRNTANEYCSFAVGLHIIETP